MSGKDDPTWVGEATYVGDATFAEDGDAGAAEVPLLAGRYRVGRLLGRGGTGQVHEALDVTTEERVAIKFVAQRSQSARRQLRQELTALRLLALPGVVRLHDDGEQGDQTYLVMDLLDGGGFDRLAGAWEGWKEQARALLEAVARVHFAGVHHLDLKPGNVLLDAEGRPVITDFGLARGRSVHNPEDAPREGTPRYMAPEQWRGEETTAATDLYAVGGIFWEMLAGRGLPSDLDARVLPVDCAPVEVRATVTAMLAEDPAQRPQTAVEVLEALFDVTAVLGPKELGLPEVAAGPEELEGLFDEDKPTFLHLARDAAKVLYELTGGERGKVRAELDRWVRAGLAWWNGERVHIERPAIEQLAFGSSELSARLAHLARTEPSAAVDLAVSEASRLVERGSAGRALGLLEATIPLARSLGRGREMAEVMMLAVVYKPDALERAIHHAVREQHRPAVLFGAGMRAKSAGALADGLELLRQVLEWTDSPTLWESAVVEYGQFLSIVDPTAFAEWLDATRLPTPLYDGGVARLCYVRGDYEGAVAAYVRAAGGLGGRRRVAALSNAAGAAVELDDVGVVIPILDALATEVVDVDAPDVEARLHWLRRVVRYRRDEPLAPQADVVAAARNVSSRLSAQMAVLEAAIAWRAHDSDTCAHLADSARSVFEREGVAAGAVLCQALAAAAVKAPSRIDPVRCMAIRPEEFAIQALALARVAGCVFDFDDALIERAAEARSGSLDRRLDVLSLREAADILGSPLTRPAGQSRKPDPSGSSQM